jgi:sugar O-acyltransferase (sialic acid O-acetyltransferase NeuD family)
VVAYIDDAHLEKKEVGGLPVVAFENVETIYPPDTYLMLIAIGYLGTNEVRTRKYEEAKQKGYSLLTYVDERSTIAEGVEIGDNCIILSNQCIGPFVKIGNNVIISSGCYIGHHVVIEDNCFIAPHVAVSGCTTIEQGSFLGTNSTVRNGVKIRKGSVIGAGAVILRDTEEYAVYKGREGELLPRKSYEVDL